MDKLDLVKELDRLAAGNDLEANEIRLYLLLLANCRGTRNGQIESATIKSAIGREFSPGRLKKACQRLAASNLLAITSNFPDNLPEENFVLSYQILLTGES
ncbi:MAG TPA: hypothetical protein VMJ66_08860 [Geobacteraceae bacterium]|nr:hypothetical protein [Geobacteraceae bacterium]